MTRSAKRREPFTLTIDNLSHEGRGVGRRDGKTVFVAGALPAETVTARKVRGRRSFDEAICVDFENPSVDRVEPRCSSFAVCGGCSLQHLSSQKQIEHKQRVLLELLEHHAQVVPTNVLPPLTGPYWHYRRRARLGVKYVPKKGGALVGFREKASPYIADIERCEVLDEAIGHRLMALRELVNSLSIREQIPQFEVAVGDTGAALVVRHLQPFTETDLELLAAFQREHAISLYLQPGGEETVHPLNDETSELSYSLGDIEFRFNPNSFVQINQALNRQMIETVCELLQLSTNDRVIDLFCGLGNFSLPIAQRAGSVVGIEGSEALVELARDNARSNQIENVEFSALDLDAPAAITTLAFDQFNTMVLDPPRSGAEQIVSSADLSALEKIAYVSCNPVTLARDARYLIGQHGFALTAAGVMDMFPHTAHVESLALFSRR